jgi:hypothetical protein
MKWARRRWRSQSGAELIEVALTLPLLLLVLLGIIEFGIMFREYEIITNAAREGARIRVLPAYDDDDAIARVNQYLTGAGLDPDLAETLVGDPEAVVIGGNCMSMIQVDVVYPHPIAFVSGIASLFGSTMADVNLSATSQMRTEATAAVCP